MMKTDEVVFSHAITVAATLKLSEAELGALEVLHVIGVQWEADRAVKGMAALACKKCGCTEHRACSTDDGPCYWVTRDPPVCSACAESE